MNDKIIIGLIGEMGAGKSTLTQYLKEKYQADTYRFSTALRNILQRLYLEETRGHLQQLSQILRDTFGQDILSRVVAEDAKNAEKKFIIIEGIRRPADIVCLKDNPGFHLVSLTAEPRIRYERLTKRTENPDDQNKTWEQFQAEAEAEAELQIKAVADLAEASLDNSQTPADLYRQIDLLITEKWK
ncbi:MAG TPA: AAA family ATPase [Patescibacteria group bacterium]|nr:AAA family ATPase [Patescibacteria group bacterium]